MFIMKKRSKINKRISKNKKIITIINGTNSILDILKIEYLECVYGKKNFRNVYFHHMGTTILPLRINSIEKELFNHKEMLEEKLNIYDEKISKLHPMTKKDWDIKLTIQNLIEKIGNLIWKE